MRSSKVVKHKVCVLSVKQFVFAVVLGLSCVAGGNAVELTGVSVVNVTSDTATSAKNKAFDMARRDIIVKALRQYVDGDSLSKAVAGAKNSELMDLVESSSIEDEKFSDTTYSANIKMILDERAVQAWLDSQNVQHWLDKVNDTDVVSIRVVLNNPVADWINLQRVARENDLNLMTRHIMGNVAQVDVVHAYRNKIVSGFKQSGWTVVDENGVLNISR